MINKAFEIAATLSDVLFLVWFVPRFIRTVLFNKKNIKFVFVPILLLVFQFLADALFPGFDLVYLVGFVAFVFAFSLLISPPKKKLRAIFASCIFIIAEMFVSSLVFAVLSFFIKDPAFMIQGSENASRIIYLTICIVARFLLFSIVLLIFSPEEGPDRKNSVFVIIYSAITAVGLVILMDFSTGNGDSKGSVIALLCIIILSSVSVFLMLRQVSKLQRKEYELSIIQERIAYAKESADNAGKLWEKIRTVRHELKNHFAVISTKLESGDIESSRKYIESLSETVDNFGRIVRTDNAIIDYLLNSKLGNLKDTEVIISGYVGSFGYIDDTDMACLVGNLIDNAIEAEERITGRKKRIELHFVIQNDNRVIICKNAIDKSVLETNGRLETTKKNKLLHGVGHKVIEEIAERYGGFVDYSEVGDMFCVKVILFKPHN